MVRIFLTSLSLCGLLCGGALAEGPKPFPKFEAKRIKPPKAGSTNRIRIQIDPTAQQAPKAKPAAEAPAEAGTTDASPGSYDWFWAKVSPEAAQSGPGRLDTAMQTLEGASAKVPSPRLQHMQEIAKANGVDILRSTIGTQVSPALVLAVITVESAGKPDATSHAGGRGEIPQLVDAGI